MKNNAQNVVKQSDFQSFILTSEEIDMRHNVSLAS